MSLLLVDGFDMYNGIGAATGLQGKWNLAASAGGTGSMVAGRFGGQALQIVSAFNIDRRSYSRAFTDQSSLVFGFAFRVTAGLGSLTSNVTGCCASLTSSGSDQNVLSVRSDGSLRFGTGTPSSNTQVAATAAGLIVASTWYYVEVAYSISATVGTVDIYIDGTLQASVTGVDTLNTTSTVNSIELTAGTDVSVTTGSVTMQWDDAYVCTGTTPLGPSRVETLRGVADILKTWTPLSGVDNYAMVNETLVDGDTTYNSSGVIGDRDLYDFGSLSSTPALIHSVNVVHFSRKTDAGPKTLYASVKSGATDSDGSAATLASTYVRYDRMIDVDPNTGSAWTASAVNGLYGGPKVAS